MNLSVEHPGHLHGSHEDHWRDRRPVERHQERAK
jgi:hypothetical protein